MRKTAVFILTIFLSASLFAVARPSLDGRAVVADEGTMPKGLFARTVGYLPGDSVTVTNPATGSSVDVLILGAIDPSEGVAILLSPQAADALRIKRNSNVQVKLTKRAGNLDANASGSAVLDSYEDFAYAEPKKAPKEETKPVIIEKTVAETEENDDFEEIEEEIKPAPKEDVKAERFIAEEIPAEKTVSAPIAKAPVEEKAVEKVTVVEETLPVTEERLIEKENEAPDENIEEEIETAPEEIEEELEEENPVAEESNAEIAEFSPFVDDEEEKEEEKTFAEEESIPQFAQVTPSPSYNNVDKEKDYDFFNGVDSVEEELPGPAEDKKSDGPWQQVILVPAPEKEEEKQEELPPIEEEIPSLKEKDVVVEPKVGEAEENEENVPPENPETEETFEEETVENEETVEEETPLAEEIEEEVEAENPADETVIEEEAEVESAEDVAETPAEETPEEIEEIAEEEKPADEAVEEESITEEAPEFEEPLEEESVDEETPEVEEPPEEESVDEEAPELEEEAESVDEAAPEIEETQEESLESVEESVASETVEEAAEEVAETDELAEVAESEEVAEEKTEEETEAVAETTVEESVVEESSVEESAESSETNNIEETVEEESISEAVEENIDEFKPIVLVPSEPNPPAATVEKAVEPVTETVVEKTERKPSKTVVSDDWKDYVLSSSGNLEKGSYYIQIANISSEEAISNIVKKYSSKYPIVLVRNTRGTAYNVMVGPLNIDEYGSVLEKFKAWGFRDAFVKPVRK